VAQQLAVLLGRELARGDAGTVQRGPEAVARPGEVVADLGRAQGRVDAAEEDVEAGPDDVRERLAQRLRSST
jgi:hypothetical protein